MGEYKFWLPDTFKKTPQKGIYRSTKDDSCYINI